jgi:type IV secretion system protein VirB3
VNADTDLTADPLFVGATRPAMKWGVSYGAILANAVITMEVFLVTQNLLTLLLALPVHGACLLLCLRDARMFELSMLWARTRGLSFAANGRFWRGSSYSPLSLPNRYSHRSGPTLGVSS